MRHRRTPSSYRTKGRHDRWARRSVKRFMEGCHRHSFEMNVLTRTPTLYDFLLLKK